MPGGAGAKAQWPDADSLLRTLVPTTVSNGLESKWYRVTFDATRRAETIYNFGEGPGSKSFLRHLSTGEPQAIVYFGSDSPAFSIGRFG
jgi:hypothetical protein